MGTRRAFGTMELLVILAILALLLWFLLSSRPANAGASLSPGIEDAIRGLLRTP